MDSKRTAERWAKYIANWIIDALFVPVYFTLVGTASLLLGDRIDAPLLPLLLGSLIAYVLSVPLLVEIQDHIQGDRPIGHNYTTKALLAGNLLGRSLGGATGFGLVLRPQPIGALLGALAGLIIAIATIIWLNSGEDLDEEEINRLNDELREELRRNR